MSSELKHSSVLERRRQRLLCHSSLPLAPYYPNRVSGWESCELDQLFKQIPALMLLFDDQLNVIRASAKFNWGKASSKKQTCRVGDLIHCAHLKGSVVGCGSRTVCRQCLLHRALTDTLVQGQPWHQIRVEQTCDRGPCQGTPWKGLLSTVLLESQGRRHVLLTLQEVERSEETEQELQNCRDHLQKLTHQLDEVEERQHRSLAEWLHDDIGQALVFAKMKIQMLENQQVPSHLQADLKSLSQFITGILDSVRSQTVHLNASVLMALGFEAASRHWIDEVLLNPNDVEIRWECQGPWDELSADLQTMMFRCLRELVINAIKHAQADLIEVKAIADSKQIHLEVCDNGCGFELDSDRLDQSGGYGLLSLRERMRQWGGHFQLHTSPGAGCQIRLDVPC